MREVTRKRLDYTARQLRSTLPIIDRARRDMAARELDIIFIDRARDAIETAATLCDRIATARAKCDSCGHEAARHGRPFSTDASCQVRRCECYGFEPIQKENKR